MPEALACLECATALTADAPEGLCPSCLLALASVAAASPQPGTTPNSGAGFIPPSPDELAGRFPQLEILELLGQGGMGAVYKARQPKLDRLVAVKILPPEWGKEPAFAERFAREAKALARLAHPQIVGVHDFGETDGLFFLVMEYVDGANWRHVLQEGRLQPSEALSIIPQICDALQYAHEEGIVHRDIKPENILLDSKGRVKIADFGLAKLVNRPRAMFTLTGSQQVMGTLDYMAPEQRLHPLEVDHRADIYSLGVVFYEMLTGELPLGRFEAPSQKVRVDARLDEVVFRALEREPQRRYQRASHVKSDLQSIVGGGPAPIHRQVPREVPLPAFPLGVDQFAITGPAAGLLLTGILAILFWTVLGISLCAAQPSIRQSGYWAAPHRWELTAEPNFARFLFLLMPALALPAGALLILGGTRMMKCRNYGLSVVCAVWAAIPWSPAWIIGLISGIFALVTLRKPEVRRAFGVSTRETSPLQFPAIGLLATGMAAALFWTILGVSLCASMPSRIQDTVFTGSGYRTVIRDYPERYLFLLMPLAGIPAASILVIGAMRMLKETSYQSSIVAALWGMLPWSPFWVVGLPFGIWALRLLRTPEVQVRFGLPFHPYSGAFENVLAFQEPGAEGVPPRKVPLHPTGSQTTGSGRRGVRAFLGSMYSLMVGSRADRQE